jgi:imidazolonepropionase
VPELVVTGIGELVTNDPGRSGLLGVVADGAVAIVDGNVAWVGVEGDLPEAHRDLPAIDAGGAAVVPGFVDAHTHIVFAGDRSEEFARRLAGDTYEEILRSGGGILSTVEATRAAGGNDLFAAAAARARHMLENGTTTVEVKSGYGLDVDTEAKILGVAARLDAELPIDVVPTFLGAHVVPAEYRDRREDYVELVCTSMLEACAPLATFCDVFCDPAAFTVDEAKRILQAGAERGLGLRLHADQLGHVGAAALAAELGAASADHVDFATPDELAALREAGTAVVLLPGVSFSMRQPYPDGRAIWDSGVTVAIATDCNPGTAWVETMPFVIALATLHMGLTPGEALWAATAGGAAALLLADRGRLAPGAVGDLVILDAPSHLHIPYRPDGAVVAAVVKRGAPV